MGLLDFDLDKVLQNPAFMLGMNIHGANTGNYGQLGPALSGGMNNFTQQQQQMLQQKMLLDKYKQQQADSAAIRKFTGGDPLELYKLKYPAQSERKMYKAADGFNYWQDTNERVNPNVQLKPTQPLVSVDMGKKAGEELGKLHAQRLGGYYTESDRANSIDAILGNVDKDLSMFETGLGSGIRLKGEQFNAFIGGDPKYAAAGENLQANINKLVMENMGALKGAMSEKELAFLENSTLGMNNTVEGNKKILQVMRKANERSRLKAVMAEDWFYKNNNSLKGFNQFWNDYLEKDSINIANQSSDGPLSFEEWQKAKREGRL